MACSRVTFTLDIHDITYCFLYKAVSRHTDPTSAETSHDNRRASDGDERNTVQLPLRLKCWLVLYFIPVYLFRTYILRSGRQGTALALGTALEHKKTVDF
jgi:type VI protein secretion system component VasF